MAGSSRMLQRAEILVADIGSTLTKLSAFKGFPAPGQGAAAPGCTFLGQGMSLTTVAEGDVRTGLEFARRDLETRFRVDASAAKLLAASSAAGGLRMSVHGLTRDMTLRAAREASLGAGAIVCFTTAGSIGPDDLESIRRIKPNIILLAGGVDYGDQHTVVGNARALAALGFDIPTIYAGNISCRSAVQRIFASAGMPLFIVDNVYPRIDELNIDPVRKVIQNVFAEHIVTAPGMDRLKKLISGAVIPTPGAVMFAAELLAELLEDVLVVDVGGATTDVHSVTAGSSRYAKLTAAPEPRSKRTVEGDLGVFVNAVHILEAAGRSGDCLEGVMPLPDNPGAQQVAVDLTRLAVDLSIWRHAGELRTAYGAYGRSELVEGRDLTAIKFVVGTGGALTRLGVGDEILRNRRSDPRQKKLLPPKNAQILLDRQYIMAAAGVLGRAYPEQAKALLLESLGVVR